MDILPYETPDTLLIRRFFFVWTQQDVGGRD